MSLGCWGAGERGGGCPPGAIASQTAGEGPHQRFECLNYLQPLVSSWVLCFQNDFLKNKANILMNYLERTFSFKH